MSIVSITIAAKNEEQNIAKSLGSALKQSYAPIEIFLIDDTSTDGTREVAGRIISEEGSEVVIIRNEKNLGFGGSHNAGMRRAKGEFVLCLNADCKLDKDYVKYAVEVLKQDRSIGAVQGKLFNPRTGKIDTTGLLIFKNRRVINRGQGVADSGQYEKPEEIWGVDGAAPVYRRAMLEDVRINNEYFDQDFFAYKEDIDLSWRMRLAGWTCFYQPKAIAHHDRSAGEGTAKNLVQIAKARQKIGEFAKFHSFANQRLMQVKCEPPLLFLKHSPRILLKEAMAWPYVLLMERHGLKSMLEFFRLLPRMIKKRKYVMAKKRISDKDFEKWLA